MSRRQRPLRRLANLRAARRRRHCGVPPARLPALAAQAELGRVIELPERFADSLEFMATDGPVRR